MIDEWMGKHLAFMARDGGGCRPEKIRCRALVAIDAGGADGATMADVHVAIRGARMPAWLVNLVVDRLVEDGHVHRVREPTAGRPRVRMWSFRHAPDEVRADMAYAGVWADNDFTRPRWAGMIQENIIVDVLRRVRGEDVQVKDLEIAAGQIYADANAKLAIELFRWKKDKELTRGQMHKLLMGMAAQRRIIHNAEVDAFRFG
jgi:hypothetical protein